MDHFHDDLIDILPGPSRTNIIWDNRYHVSEDVWDGSGREELECVCGNRAMRDWKLRRPQRELLHMLGFGIFSNPHVVLSNDARLISALIERWRPETNTFFMRQGEMTVTLEDVGYILGLPVVGEAVTCGLIENRREFFVRNWFEPLTGVEVDNALFRNHIKLTWLFDRYGREKPEKGNVEATVLHTQAYLLFLFGAVLFPTTDKAYVHVRYIVPVQNIREIPNYAWGAAVLAHLYRGLEHAAMKKTKMVAACVWLLHIWSYERFPRIGVPQRGDSLHDYPVAEGWAYSSVQGINKKRRQSGPHHSLPFYRGEFDGVAGDDVVWRPYARFDEVVDWEMLQAQLAVPPWLINIIQKIFDESRLFPSAINHVLINEYLPNQGIMPHQDGPAYFPVVAIVSLGSPVVMDFSPHLSLTVSTNQSGNGMEDELSCTGVPDGNLQNDYNPFSVLLMPRSLLIFKDKAYSEYMHGIKDCPVQRCDRVVNVGELLKYRGADQITGSKDLYEGTDVDLNSINRTTNRISLTCRVVPKVNRKLFKF